jgi:hypothetical protein
LFCVPGLTEAAQRSGPPVNNYGAPVIAYANPASQSYAQAAANSKASLVQEHRACDVRTTQQVVSANAGC